MKKKKRFLALALVMAGVLLGGCTAGNLMQVTFWLTGPQGAEQVQAARTVVISDASAVAATAASTEDMVTIPRKEYERLLQFSEAMEILNVANQYFYQEPDQQKMLDTANRGLLAGLGDPYSFYYSPEEFAEMKAEDEGRYEGIGVLISSNAKTQICKVSRVFKNTPAEEAGVQRGDILYKVGEDYYITADNLNEAVRKYIRGEPGTTVTLTFLRDGEEMVLTIPRRAIEVNQIEATMLDKRIGYIALYQFAGQCQKEFETALNSLLVQGMKGLIIDVRNNPGGWVMQARDIADLFLDKGELCYLVYRNGLESHSEYPTYDGGVKIPLVVLINEDSASSSEILSGALRDRAGATLVGVTSFGKGIIQAVWDVGNRGAGFQMTIAQYMTPSGYASSTHSRQI